MSAGLRTLPRQSRAVQTCDRLLDVAAGLLAEVGIEGISTNLICARAGLTPPALYRYYSDKYAVLEALGKRLMDQQNAVLEAWLATSQGLGIDGLQDGIEQMLRDTAAVTAAQPGAVWILRALHATPRLVHVRVASHRYVTDRLVDAYAVRLPSGTDRDALWRRLRVSVEIGFAVDAMLHEETRVAPDAVFQMVAAMLRGG